MFIFTNLNISDTDTDHLLKTPKYIFLKNIF